MNSVPANNPPSRTLPHELVEGFFTLFVGFLIQIGRTFLLFAQKIKRSLARKALRTKSLIMGASMEKAGMGDQLLLQKLKAIPTEDRSRADERNSVLAQLGESGLEPGVPPIGLDEAYHAGHQAYKDARAAEERHDYLARAIWPHSAIGWFSLLGSYLLTVFCILLALAYFAPAHSPTVLARWFHKDPQRPESAVLIAESQNIRVTVKKVTLGREQTRLNNGKMAVETSDVPTLHITLFIENRSDKELNYKTWRALTDKVFHHAGNIIDNRGNTVNRMVLPLNVLPNGGVHEATVRPNQSVQDVLIFAEPKQGFRHLDLFLPGENVGLKDDTLIFKLPVEIIEVPVPSPSN